MVVHHDIVDNRQVKLAETVNRMLSTTEAARFAVGYFFLSGFTGIAEKLAGVKELRLLIGNTTSRETLEQMAEGRQRLELVADRVEKEAYLKRSDGRAMAEETAANVRSSIELMDQTDENEELVRSLAQMMEEKRVKVKVYTKGRLHAKAYIFDYAPVFDQQGKPVERHEQGVAVVGSSNLSLAGLAHNTELNVVVHGNNNHAELVRWFDDLWQEAEEFDTALMAELTESWAARPASPYDIYMKTLYELVRERIEDGGDREMLWDDDIIQDLADFQVKAVNHAIRMMKDYGGAFVADVVGLGKSYVGAAICKHFVRTRQARPLIICPASLVEMWEHYNARYELNAQVVSTGYLKEGDDGAPDFLTGHAIYRNCDLLLLDESHNLRHSDTQRYRVVQAFLATGKPCCFLTATPRNKTAWDVYHQVKLFHQDDKTDLPVDPPDLNKYFKLIEKGERKLPELLYHLQVRRLRRHVLRWYGYAGDTDRPLRELSEEEVRPYLEEASKAYVLVGNRKQFFPLRRLKTVEYSIEDTYQGLYHQLRGYLGTYHRSQTAEPRKGELTFARYGLWHYVKTAKQQREPYAGLHRAGVNLRGLIRVLLFKRLESSVEAFRRTVRKVLAVQERFLAGLDAGIIPAGEPAQDILHEPGSVEEQDLVDALRAVSGKYRAEDFEVERLKRHIRHDVALLRQILELVEPITPDKDAKLLTLKHRLAEAPLAGGKRLIFTQYADTADYLFKNLNPGGARDDIEVTYSGDKSKLKVVGRFAPKANPEYALKRGETEIATLIATDVLAEGLNLQDCNMVVNYDLHWNPVRLIQRFGRIDRIGTEHEEVFGFNFLPETGLERNLGLHQKLAQRIQEIHKTIGEDAKVLDESEHLNKEAMYAIYEQKSAGQLDLFGDAGGELVDLAEAEEFLRQMQRDNPVEFERIAGLRDGIRSSKPAAEPGLFVHFAAGDYRQLFLVNDAGEVLSRDIPRVLAAIRSDVRLAPAALPRGYNKAVMRAMGEFGAEVRKRKAERKYVPSLTHGQRYALRELRVLYEQNEDESVRDQIARLEKAFRGPVTTAVKRLLNRVRLNGMTGMKLLKELTDTYLQHGMKDRAERVAADEETAAVPRVVCSEKLR
jgi:superfamily II DNA or RNA helicase